MNVSLNPTRFDLLAGFQRMMTLKVVSSIGGLAVVCGVVASILLKSPHFWQLGFGVCALLLFLRWPSLLLFAWVLGGPLIGSNVLFFNGNHFLDYLIIPTMLILLFVPWIKLLRMFPTLLLLALFLVWVLCGFFVASIGHGTFLKLWLSDVQFLTVAALTLACVTTRQRLWRLIDALLLFSVFAVLYGVTGYFTKQHLVYDPFTGQPRMLSLFDATNAVAMFLSTTLFLTIYRFVTLKGLWRVLPGLALLLLLAGVGLTVTRAAFVALPLGLLTMVFCVPSRRLQLRLAAGLLLSLLALVLVSTVAHVAIFQRFFSSDLLTLDGRIYIWQAVLAHFDPAKILGAGLKGSDLLLARLQVRDQYGVIGVVAHSMFLETLYDHGIIGLLILIAVFASLLLSLIQGVRRTHGEQRWLFAVTLGTFVCVLIQAVQLNDLMTDLTITSYFWIVMALPFAPVWHTRATPELPVTTPEDVAPVAPTDLSDWQGERVAVNPLRVCILSLGFAPLVGGSEKQAERHARLLQDMGHEVLVITLRRRKELVRYETLHGLPVIRVGGFYQRTGQLRIGRVGFLPVSIALFITLWRWRRRYDLIHVWQAFFPAAVASLFGLLFEKPVIVSIQNTGPTDEQRSRLAQEVTLLADTLPDAQDARLRLTFWDWASGEGDITYLPAAVIGGTLLLHVMRKLATRFHVLSTRGYFYLTAHGFPPERIVAIPYGIDTARFQPGAEAQGSDPMHSERKVLCVARLEYAKGIDILLHAWKHLMDKQASWERDLHPVLQLAGDGSLRTRLLWMAEQLGIQESVEFLGTREDVLDLLQHAWAFVLPSRWEGLPNALLEAMAAGLPCVAARVSGSEDVLVDGVNGLLVDPEQPLALAEALQRLLLDDELNQQLRLAARASAVQGYQLSYTVGRALDLYYQLLAEYKIAIGGLP